MSRSHDHRAFGLTIRADRAIPGLPARARSGAPDLRVEFPDRPPAPLRHRRLWYESPLDSNRQRLRVWREPDGDVEFAYSDGARFRVRSDGGRVTAWWPEPLTLADAATYLLGPVVGLVLRLRGEVCLHASAVGVDGGAIGILAPARHGKSTTAAAFALDGHPVLTDDVLVLEERDGGFLVHPAYPWLRLWPAAVEALFGSVEALPRISPDHPDWDKRYLDLGGEGFAFADRPLPLVAVYTGVRDDAAVAPRLEEIPLAEALLVLVANGYASRLLDRPMRAREFDVLARLAERVPVVRFGIREGIERLAELREAVVADCRARRSNGARASGATGAAPSIAAASGGP